MDDLDAAIRAADALAKLAPTALELVDRWRGRRRLGRVGRLDWVTVATPSGPVTISWEQRNQLLDRLRVTCGRQSSVVAAFEAVGATRPVELNTADGLAVLETLDAWLDEEGIEAIPQRLAILRNALHDDTEDG
jgi:hypothetical protein